MTRSQLILFLLLGCLLYVFNSCSSEFEAVSSSTGSLGATCNAKASIDDVVTQSVSDTAPLSPFAQGKLLIDDKLGPTAQKISAPTQYLAIIDNNCLRNAEAGSLAKEFAGNEQPEDLLNQQPYLLSETSDELLNLEGNIEADPCIIGVSSNRKYQRSALSSYLNDPSINQQNHLTAIQLEGALAEILNTNYGLQINNISNPVIVAVLDTGVNYDHPDLGGVVQRLPQGPGVQARSLGTSNVIYDGRDISPEGHGSHVAGLIAAQGNNAIGGSGAAAYGVKILPINVFFPDGDDVSSDSATIIKGINFAVQQGVSLMNLSVGGRGNDPAVKAAIQQAIAANIFVVASAGNTSGNETAFAIGGANPVFPAMYGGELLGMVTVGSTDTSTGAKSYFSLYSSTLVEMSAPGAQNRTTGLYSTTLNSSYSLLMGTSMAAPVVTGAAALAQTFYRHHYKADLSPAALEDILRASATKNPGLTSYFKDGNQLNMAQLIKTLQARYPLTAGKTTVDCP